MTAGPGVGKWGSGGRESRRLVMKGRDGAVAAGRCAGAEDLFIFRRGRLEHFHLFRGCWKFLGQGRGCPYRRKRAGNVAPAPPPARNWRTEGLGQRSSVLPRTEKSLAVGSSQLRWVAIDLEAPIS